MSPIAIMYFKDERTGEWVPIPTGKPGPPGAEGPPGPRGSLWFVGNGPPAPIEGTQSGDMYLDGTSGDVYQLDA